MIIFYSGDGGARSNIPERVLAQPTVMLSYFSNVHEDVPDGRFKAMIRYRKKHPPMQVFHSGNAGGSRPLPEDSLPTANKGQGPDVMLSYQDIDGDGSNNSKKRFTRLEKRRKKGNKDMRIFYSGYSNRKSRPEHVLTEVNDDKGADLMLTYHEIHENVSYTIGRFNAIERRRKGIDKEGDERIHLHFLDSGAHSIFVKEVRHKWASMLTPELQAKLESMSSQERSAFRRHSPNLFKTTRKERYKFYYTEEFWDRVDAYAAFVRKHKIACDYYANLDVIFHPELSWEVQQYLENKHKLSPVPVIHFGTPIKWVKHYLDQGYDFIGLGGLGQETRPEQYYAWADQVYNLICPPPKRIPIVKTHGFAMTMYELMLRYPWWSVDSASWVKCAAFGSIFVPHKRKGKFVFDEKPYNLPCSALSTAMSEKKHLTNLPKASQRIVLEWLEKIGVPLGSVDKQGDMRKWGVVSHHGPRKIANLKFFEMLKESLPEWPWRFEAARSKATFNL